MKSPFASIIFRFFLLGFALAAPLGIARAESLEPNDPNDEQPAVITAEVELPGNAGKVKFTIGGFRSDQHDLELAARMVNSATEDAPSTRVVTVENDPASEQAYEVMLRLRRSPHPIERVTAELPAEFKQDGWVSGAWKRLVASKLGAPARLIKKRYAANHFNFWVGTARATLNGALGAASVWIAPADKLSNVTFDKAFVLGAEMWAVGFLCQIYYDELKWFMTTPAIRNLAFGVKGGLETLEERFGRGSLSPEEKLALARGYIREQSADEKTRRKLPTEDASKLRDIVEKNLSIKSGAGYRSADYSEVLLHWLVVEIAFASILKTTMIAQGLINETLAQASGDIVWAASQTMFAQGLWDAIILKWEDKQKAKLRATIGEEHPDYPRRLERVDRMAKVAMAVNSAAATGIGLAGILTGNQASMYFLTGMSIVGAVTYGAMALKESRDCSGALTNGPPAAKPEFQNPVDADEQRLKEFLRRHVG